MAALRAVNILLLAAASILLLLIFVNAKLRYPVGAFLDSGVTLFSSEASSTYYLFCYALLT
jgi:hypothetical protein